jgi:hypothetical protein
MCCLPFVIVSDINHGMKEAVDETLQGCLSITIPATRMGFGERSIGYRREADRWPSMIAERVNSGRSTIEIENPYGVVCGDGMPAFAQGGRGT